MNKRGKHPFGKLIKYFFDNYVFKSFWTQVLVLFLTVFALSFLFGTITMRLGDLSYVDGYWTSLMHIIDQGTVTGDEQGTDAYFMFMLFITFIGMAIMGTIIAIITNAIQGKINEQKKGHSPIIKKNHVVILGFDENAYTICKELTDGNRVKGTNSSLVIADDIPMEEMAHTVEEYHSGRQYFLEKDPGSSKTDRKLNIIFRSGDTVSENTFAVCSVQTAKAIIINRDNDFDTIRIILSLAAYLKRNNAYLESDSMPSIIATIHDLNNLEAAVIATGLNYSDGKIQNGKNTYKIQIIFDKYIQTRLFAQSCIHHGLPLIIDSLINYRGSSVHIEMDDDFSEEENPFMGKTLTEISGIVSDAIPLGFADVADTSSDYIYLNPGEDKTYGCNDRLIYLSRNNKIHLGIAEHAKPLCVPKTNSVKERKILRNFLLIGSSSSLFDMADYLGRSCLKGSTVNLLSSDVVTQDELKSSVFSTHVTPCENPYFWNEVKNTFEENKFWFDMTDNRHLTNIVILSPKEENKTLADEKVMVLLLSIRNYIKNNDLSDINITSIMQLPKNQMLLQKNNDNDFVSATEISNRILAQITDDPRKYWLMDELLEQNNAAIELYPLSDYVDVSKEFNFEGVFRLVSSMEKEAGNSIIPLGWLQLEKEDSPDNSKPELVLNPAKSLLEEHHIGEAFSNYHLIVLTGSPE